jgi:hypothetical protein
MAPIAVVIANLPGIDVIRLGIFDTPLCSVPRLCIQAANVIHGTFYSELVYFLGRSLSWSCAKEDWWQFALLIMKAIAARLLPITGDSQSLLPRNESELRVVQDARK